MKRNRIYKAIVSENVDFPAKAEVRTISEITQSGEEIILNDDDRENAVIKNVIPGQTILYRLKKRGTGELQEVLEKSKDETVAPCTYFGSCGGCVYQTLKYDRQLEYKLNSVKKLMDEEDLDKCQGITESPSVFNYRNKMEYSFGNEYKDGPLVLGLHKRKSRYDIVPCDECMLVHEDNNKIVSITQEYFRNKNIQHYHNGTKEGILRNLVVRRSFDTKELLIAIVTTTQQDTEQLLEGWVKELTDRENELEGSIAGILHTKNDSPADAVINEGTTLLYGKDYIVEEVLGLKFKVTAYSFFQTNSKGAERLYEKVREYALESIEDKDNKPVIYDLYSGTGTIAQMMTSAASHVVGIEIVEEAVEAARKNMELNGLTNCEFIAGDVLEKLDELEKKPDFIILDPPRDGVHAKALKKIIDYGVDNIVYISCKPTSLVRDLVMLKAEGYHVKKWCCVDMFPGTGHVESVCLLSNRKPDTKVRIKVGSVIKGYEKLIPPGQF